MSERTRLEECWKALDLEDGSYDIAFCVPRDFGEPGAILVDSVNSEEFYIQSLTLNSHDSRTEYEFACNSYINKKSPTNKPKIDDQISDTDRIFFTNKVTLPALMHRPSHSGTAFADRTGFWALCISLHLLDCGSDPFFI